MKPRGRDQRIPRTTPFRFPQPVANRAARYAFRYANEGRIVEQRPVTLDGLTPDEVLALPDEAVDALVLCGEPLVFRAGTADLLGRFWVAGESLVLELGHIDGGGEGVLPAIAGLAERYARRRGLSALDWRVHALNCARPNPKLRRVLERRGFAVVDVPGSGPCYHQVQPVEQRPG